MNIPTVKECVEGTVTFAFYRDNTLWYKAENGFQFPVPIREAGSATFLNQDKGIYFMRWIRKHIEDLDYAVNGVNRYKEDSWKSQH